MITRAFRRAVEQVIGRGAWTTFPFAANWSDNGGGYQTCQYRKVGDVVQLRGVATCANWAANPTVGTLPVGYRPLAQTICAVKNATTVDRIDVNSTGTVVPTGAVNSWLSLDGIQFSTI